METTNRLKIFNGLNHEKFKNPIENVINYLDEVIIYLYSYLSKVCLNKIEVTFRLSLTYRLLTFCLTPPTLAFCVLL